MSNQPTINMDGWIRKDGEWIHPEPLIGPVAETGQCTFAPAPESAETPTPEEVCSEILAEVTRATLKFPTWPTDPIHAFAVVGEEFGELQKEVLQLVYEPHKSSKDAVRKEAVQLAAMSLRFLISLDRYEYASQPQHSQSLLATGKAQP